MDRGVRSSGSGPGCDECKNLIQANIFKFIYIQKRYERISEYIRIKKRYKRISEYIRIKKIIRIWYEQIFVSESIRISEYSSHPAPDQV